MAAVPKASCPLSRPACHQRKENYADRRSCCAPALQSIRLRNFPAWKAAGPVGQGRDAGAARVGRAHAVARVVDAAGAEPWKEAAEAWEALIEVFQALHLC